MHFTQIENISSQNGGWIRPSKFKYGLQINQLLNGSGHGMLTDVDLIFKLGKSEVATGLFFQSKYQKISGISLQYKYFITNGMYTNLYTHYSFMFHYQNCLNDNLNKLFHPQDFGTCCEFEKFNTMTHNIGIGLETMTFNNLYIDLKIGVGGYFSSVEGNDNRNKNVFSREDNGFSVMGSVGILYRISTKDKKRRFGHY